MSNGISAKRRENKWLTNPFCKNCGIFTVLPPPFRQCIRKQVPDYTATIQHWYPKNHPMRKYCKHTTIFCWRCNNEDAKAQEAQLRENQLNMNNKDYQLTAHDIQMGQLVEVNGDDYLVLIIGAYYNDEDGILMPHQDRAVLGRYGKKGEYINLKLKSYRNEN